MDRQQILTIYKRNVAIFSAVALGSCIASFWMDAVSLFVGGMFGASVCLAIFEVANIKTYRLFSEVVEALQAASDRENTRI